MQSSTLPLLLRTLQKPRISQVAPQSSLISSQSSITLLQGSASWINNEKTPTTQGSWQQTRPKLDNSVEMILLKIQNDSLKRESQKAKQNEKKLRKQLQEKMQMLQKFNDLMKLKYGEIKKLKTQNQEKQKKIAQMQLEKQGQLSLQQAQRLKQVYMEKCAQYDQLTTKISNLQHQSFHNQLYQMKVAKLYDQLEYEKAKGSQLSMEKAQLAQLIKQLEEKVNLLQFQGQKSITFNKILQQSMHVQKLFTDVDSSVASRTSSPSKYESPSKNGSPSKPSSSSHLHAFEDALKVQLKHIEELKQVVESSKELVQTLRDSLASSRRELESLRAEMKIVDLKANSERKKIIMECRLQLHEKDNEINSTFKNYKTLGEKYKNALQEIKSKDDFLKKHLLGRLTESTVQQYVQTVLEKYTDNFSSAIELRTENKELTQKLEKYQKYEKQIQISSLID